MKWHNQNIFKFIFHLDNRFEFLEFLYFLFQLFGVYSFLNHVPYVYYVSCAIYSSVIEMLISYIEICFVTFMTLRLKVTLIHYACV